MALNRQLVGDPQLAYSYYCSALEVWQQIGETHFAILALKHIIHLCQTQLKASPAQVQEYVNLLNHYLQEDFNGANPETLFKDFEKKIQCAKEVRSRYIDTQNIYICSRDKRGPWARERAR